MSGRRRIYPYMAMRMVNLAMPLDGYFRPYLRRLLHDDLHRGLERERLEPVSPVTVRVQTSWDGSGRRVSMRVRAIKRHTPEAIKAHARAHPRMSAIEWQRGQ